MQFSSHIQNRPYRCESPSEKPRVPLKHPFVPQNAKPPQRNLSSPLKNVVSTGSSGVWCEFKGGQTSGGEEQKPLVLPVIVRKSGRAFQYVWDGSQLRLVDFDRELSESKELAGDGFSQSSHMVILVLRELFVPKHVQENYMGYLKWKLLHRIFSSCLQVLATQAMFRAIGIGSSYALPSAAALNWLLKDGLGRLSRCIYTATLGSAFDTNLKRVRFSTSILFTLSIGVELLTPAFPQHFLLLATLANIAKSVSLAAYIATGTAIHRSFAVADNLGEVSAKAQLQRVCFDNLGLMLAALLNILCRNNRRFQTGLTVLIYPIFSAVDLFSIYHALRHVHLQTLTKNRLEIITDTFIQFGYVPSPAEVSNMEGINLFNLNGNKLLPIRIGCVDPRTQQRILLCLEERARACDIIMGLLQACYIRRALGDARSKWDAGNEDSFLTEWFKVVEEAKRRSVEQFPLLSESMRSTGWAMKNILLSSQEQSRYVLVNDG